jgi:hypothetical protein
MRSSGLFGDGCTHIDMQSAFTDPTQVGKNSLFLEHKVDVEATLAIRHRLEAYATLTPSRGGCWFADLPVGDLEASLHTPEDQSSIGFLPVEFGHFQSVAQSGLKSIAQGLPRVNPGLSSLAHFGAGLEAYATLTPSRGGCWFVDLPVGDLEASLHAPED